MFTFADTAGLDKCGVEVPLPEYNGLGVTAYTASARKKGAPVYFTFSATAGQELTATTPASHVNVAVGYAYDNIAAGAIGLFVTAGFCVPILVETATARAAGIVMEVLDSGTYCVYADATTTIMTTVDAFVVLQEEITAAEVTAQAAAGTTNFLKNCLVLPNVPFTGVAAYKTIT
jgi:hypothetical protein